MSSAHLDGARAKVARAKQHLKELETEISEGAGKTYGIVLDHHPETGKQVIRAKAPRDLLLRWGIITGDIAHNCHSALDHVVWQLVERRHQKHGRQAFPIYSEIREFAEAGLDQIAGIGKEATAIIERLQPYHGGDKYNLETLWILRELSNRDKHRVVNVVAFAAQVSEVRAIEGRPIENTVSVGPSVQDFQSTDFKWTRRPGELEDGAIVHEFTDEELSLGMNVQHASYFEIKFEESAPAVGGLFVHRTLANLIRTTEEIIELFDPLFL